MLAYVRAEPAALYFRVLTVVPGDLGVREQRTCWSLTVSWGMLLVFLISSFLVQSGCP